MIAKGASQGGIRLDEAANTGRLSRQLAALSGAGAIEPGRPLCRASGHRSRVGLLGLGAAVVACALAGLSPGIATANPMLHAGAGKVVDGAGAPVLLRCVSLSPWLIPEGYLAGQGSLAALETSPSQLRQRLTEAVGAGKARAFWSAWQEHFAVAADFHHLHDEGFNCVRLPLSYRSLIGSQAGGALTFDAHAIAQVDHAVAWAARSGIYVFLDLHDAPGGQNPMPSVSDVPSTDKTARLWQGPSAPRNQRTTVELWRVLARRYADARAVGGYDLLNEPMLPKPATAMLGTLYRQIATAIRTVDRNHMLVLEGNDYAHDFTSLRDFPDRDVMYEFHEYAIFNRAWRTPNSRALAPFLALRAATGRPLWLGEFGENTLQWQTAMVQLMKASDIGWAVWPWKRIDLGNGHPVIETIEPPRSWRQISGYLVGRMFARRPSVAEAERAMADMLEAIRTPNCREDTTLEQVLAGR